MAVALGSECIMSIAVKLQSNNYGSKKQTRRPEAADHSACDRALGAGNLGDSQPRR
jgi:hypothetical protein